MEHSKLTTTERLAYELISTSHGGGRMILDTPYQIARNNTFDKMFGSINGQWISTADISAKIRRN